MDIRIQPRLLSGTVTPPVSKSLAHRVMLSALLAGDGGPTWEAEPSQDIRATARCVAALRTNREGLPLLDCGESGSTLRFLIPIALALRGGGVFVGQGRLMERPQQPYFDLFDQKGISHTLRNGVLTVQGLLPPGEYLLPGDVSSQFVTGLLYALPLLEGDSRIRLTSPLESRGYVDMTLEVLAQSGITVENRDYAVFFIPGRQHFRTEAIALEADWSQAAFWYAANFLGSTVNIQALNTRSSQGDMAVAELYWKLARPGDVEIDVSGCPDLLPPLAVMAAVRRGTTRFTNAGRLRLKESDRLDTTAALLTALGGRAETLPDTLTVHGGPLSGGTVDGAGDHRIVMAAAVAATYCQTPVTILGAEAVNKSYPGFFEDYQALGGEMHVL